MCIRCYFGLFGASFPKERGILQEKGRYKVYVFKDGPSSKSFVHTRALPVSIPYQPHLWHLIHFYTVCRCSLYGCPDLHDRVQQGWGIALYIFYSVVTGKYYIKIGHSDLILKNFLRHEDISRWHSTGGDPWLIDCLTKLLKSMFIGNVSNSIIK